eukprot:CAMPEP_0205904872 /NCGR_PEP_ID=MMETSP1325-20131115/988_1 /ASSEMBLY_ACC=CAM_ASM_000708 /TAXON_ID=236786 /ORGANISM="Florenciella sp., Strain RCC1007" /LENGTH=794 /DNA_ID=CAMNT_0053270713 /DNA_START=111 /DNA_END=2495 /DNA_ORIENTATION=+
MTPTKSPPVLKLTWVATGEVRRVGKAPSSLQALPLAEMFGKAQDYTLTYVDDEGDTITVQTESEYVDALEVAADSNIKTLRMNVYASKAECLEHQKIQREEVKEAAAKTTLPAPREPLRVVSDGLSAEAPAPNLAIHHGIECDRSGQCPIIGTRFKLRGHDYDLCEAEFVKLPIEDQAKFDKIETPQGMGNRRHRSSANANPAIHYGVSCDRSGQCPIIGTRYKLRGQNYDLNETEFLKLPIEEQAKFEKIETPRMRRACGPRGPRCPAMRAQLGHLGDALSPATLEILDSMPLDELIMQQCLADSIAPEDAPPGPSPVAELLAAFTGRPEFEFAANTIKEAMEHGRAPPQPQGRRGCGRGGGGGGGGGCGRARGRANRSHRDERSSGGPHNCDTNRGACSPPAAASVAAAAAAAMAEVANAANAANANSANAANANAAHANAANVNGGQALGHLIAAMAGPAINAALGAAMDPNNAHGTGAFGCPGMQAAGPAGVPPAIHFGVTCDKSGMSPIVGPRYHVPDADYDLCEEEYNKLPEAERLTFVKIERPGASWIRPDAWAQDEAPAAATAAAVSTDDTTKSKPEAETKSTETASPAPAAAVATNDDENEDALLQQALAASLSPPTDEAGIEEEKTNEIEAKPNTATETGADGDADAADAGSEASWTAVEAQTDADADADAGADAAAAAQAEEQDVQIAQNQPKIIAPPTETTDFDEQLAELARMGFDGKRTGRWAWSVNVVHASHWRIEYSSLTPTSLSRPPDRDSNIALLKRYQGRLDRVINFLLELGEGRV